MGTTVEELKKLYKKLGGEEPGVASRSTSGEVLNAINELNLATEYELPKLEAGDDGKVLTANNKKWTKADPIKELPAFDPVEDEGKILGIKDGVLAWVNPTEGNTDNQEPVEEVDNE